MDKKTMNERVKILRKDYLKLSQEEFAGKILVSDGLISAIELEKTVLKESTMRLICLVFKVNENWLKEGTDPVFLEEFPDFEELFILFDKLLPRNKKMVFNYIQMLLDDQEEHGETEGTAPERRADTAKNPS